MAELELYGGDYILDFDGRKHTYRVNGRPVPSVTKVTGVIDKPALQYWAVNCTLDYLGDTIQPDKPYNANQLKSILADAKSARFRKSQDALNIGSQAHDWIERYVKAKLWKYKVPALPQFPPVLSAVQSYLDWEAEHEIVYWSSERKVYSAEYDYCGTVDVIMDVDGRTMVGDFKTSAAIYPEYWLQVAAYAQAVAEEDAVTIDDVMIVRIPKDGEPAEVQVAGEVGLGSWQEVFVPFMGALALYRYLDAAKKNGNG